MSSGEKRWPNGCFYVYKESFSKKENSGHSSIYLNTKTKTKKKTLEKIIISNIKNVNKQPKEICEESFMGDAQEDKQLSVSSQPRYYFLYKQLN